MNQNHQPTDQAVRELITELRALAPKRSLTYGQSIQVARNQAMRARSWRQAEDTPELNLAWLRNQQAVPVFFFPSYRLNEHSGLTTDQVTGTLSMFINDQEPWVRQRFSLSHEFKHVLDWDDAALLHAKLGQGDPQKQHNLIEAVANEFAAYLLMPTMLVKRHWFRSQHLGLMSTLFNVSAEAMNTRLEKLGLIGEPKSLARHYFRGLGLPASEPELNECA